jgi:hypothetical protein
VTEHEDLRALKFNGGYPARIRIALMMRFYGGGGTESWPALPKNDERVEEYGAKSKAKVA